MDEFPNKQCTIDAGIEKNEKETNPNFRRLRAHRVGEDK